MSTYYKIQGLHKFTEEDIYDEGCIPESSSAQSVEVTFKGENSDSVIQQFCDFLGVNNDSESVEKNACEEKGRVDIALMENGEGYQATPSQLAKWKNNNCRLWYAVYTGYVVKIIEEEVEL